MKRANSGLDCTDTIITEKAYKSIQVPMTAIKRDKTRNNNKQANREVKKENKQQKGKK